MNIRSLFGLVPRPVDRLETAFDPVDFAKNSGQSRSFREFTAPPRRQAGGGARLGVRHHDNFARIAIVPNAGGNIP